MSKRTLKTKLCDMLGIEYPILSAGMGPTLIGETTGAPVELVVAVSEAGGLGVLGGSGFTVDKLRDAIREIKARTDGRVKLKFYPGGIMGNEQTVLRKMRVGQLHGGAFTTGALTLVRRDLDQGR